MDTGLIVDALKMGAVDAVPVDEDQFFIQSVARALFNLEQRRRLRYWKRRFSESEDRFESLILSSQDGIAIIQEGKIVPRTGGNQRTDRPRNRLGASSQLGPPFAHGRL